MARILGKNGVDNTNIDGASFNNFCAGQRSGIIKGRLNECVITSPSSSVLTIATGELLIYGIRIVLNNATQFSFATFPATATRYSIVAEIVIDDNAEPTERIFIQNASTALVQNNLFKNENGAGTYQIELGKFTLSGTGISALIRTVDIITGGTAGESELKIGEVITETVPFGADAEVDIDYNEDSKAYDFQFQIPNGGGTNVKVGGLIQTEVNFDDKENVFEKNSAFNKNFETTSTNIKGNGTQSVGVLETIPKADHIHPHDSTKSDKVIGAVSGNFANLDATGNLEDSGRKADDFVEKDQTVTNAKKTMTVDDAGEVVSTDYIYLGDIKLYKEVDNITEEVSVVFEFPEEEE